MGRAYFVYILTNKTCSVLYTGMTRHLAKRVEQRRQSKAPHFVPRYRVHRLVYYESFYSPYEAIAREKQIKAGSREAKMRLIDGANPQWRDLAPDLYPSSFVWSIAESNR